ncbi:MAG TPA: carboxypeptidase-like regulatory domain-containing protein, partial [Candidatus Limnocylindria bacterium]|nr:carboxypeptidase-like regulatory domain-containing protein [Candidatus Limnocylindria bacterium]
MGEAGAPPAGVLARALVLVLVISAVGASPAAAGTGAISGRVTDGAGNGRLCQVNVWGSSSVVASANSNMDGTYTVGGLDDGTYRVSVATGGSACSGFADEFYRDQPDGSTATPVVVSGGGTTSGIDITLGNGTTGAIRGRVTNTSGTPLNGCVVDAINTSTGEIVFSQTTLALAPDGTYVITPLAPAPYKVRFRACSDGGVFYGGEFHADRADGASADIVTVTAGSTTAGIHGTLAPSTPGGISGFVTDGAGNGLSCQVNFWDELSTFTGSVYSAVADGAYLKDDLPAGNYRVEVVAGLGCAGSFSEWYQD